MPAKYIRDKSFVYSCNLVISQIFGQQRNRKLWVNQKIQGENSLKYWELQV